MKYDQKLEELGMITKVLLELLEHDENVDQEFVMDTLKKRYIELFLDK
jgi:hypothetical protein